VVHDAVDINSLIRDVVQHGPHRQGCIPQNVILPDLQQLAPIAQTPHAGLHETANSHRGWSGFPGEKIPCTGQLIHTEVGRGFQEMYTCTGQLNDAEVGGISKTIKAPARDS
jgi:hypothetical protein